MRTCCRTAWQHAARTWSRTRPIRGLGASDDTASSFATGGELWGAGRFTGMNGHAAERESLGQRRLLCPLANRMRAQNLCDQHRMHASTLCRAHARRSCWARPQACCLCVLHSAVCAPPLSLSRGGGHHPDPAAACGILVHATGRRTGTLNKPRPTCRIGFRLSRVAWNHEPVWQSRARPRSLIRPAHAKCSGQALSAPRRR